MGQPFLYTIVKAITYPDVNVEALWLWCKIERLPWAILKCSFSGEANNAASFAWLESGWSFGWTLMYTNAETSFASLEKSNVK